MNTEKTGKIYTALADIMSDVEAVKKNKSNAQQGFKYRGIDDLFNALHNSFAKNKVFISFDVKDNRTETLEQNNKLLFKICLLVEYKFVADDGSYVTTTTYTESLDFGDKGAGKALSYALKYVLMQMFLIPTDDTKDNDSESIEVQKKTETKKATASAMPEGERIKAIKEIKEAKTLDELRDLYSKYKDYYNALSNDFASRKKELEKGES